MIIAFVVGLVLGGSQALSRAMFAKMVPKGYEVLVLFCCVLVFCYVYFVVVRREN